jgi:hypothetical protein
MDPIHLKNPVSFSEKLQKPLLTTGIMYLTANVKAQ